MSNYSEISNTLNNIPNSPRATVEINDEGRLTLNGKLICFLEKTPMINVKSYIREHSNGDNSAKKALIRAVGKWYIDRGTKMATEGKMTCKSW